MMALKVFLLKRQLTILLNLSLIFSHCLWKLELSLRIWKLLGLYQFLRPVTKEFSNYRPISILPCISKILERLVFSRLFNHLDANNILYKHQYGFRKRHSTEHALIQLVNYISSALDNKKNLLLESSWTWVRHSIRSVTIFWLPNLVDTEWRMLPWDGLEAT